MSEKWDRRFVEMACMVASWSKDPSTKCGGVIVRPDRTVAAVGYNGFPRGVEDNEGLLGNRDEKYPRTIHSEVNAILSAKEPLTGYTLYQWPGRSCAPCAAVIIQAGITRVVNPNVETHGIQWLESQEIGLEMFKEAGVAYEPIDV